MAIPNLYQSVWEKLLEKIENSHFWPFQICTSLFGKNCSKKFGRAIFGHSKFIPVSLGKIVQKNLEQPFLAIPNLYQSFQEKLLEKIENSHFWPIQICTSLFRKNCWKNLEWPFLAISNLYQSLWEKLLEKNQSSHFGHSKFIPVSWEKLLEKNQSSHFWPFQIYTSLFGKNCSKKFGRAIFGHSKLIPVCLGKIVGKKLRTAIFGHSKFVAVFLGKIVEKNLEQPFLAIPNLYQSFWEKLLGKN